MKQLILKSIGTFINTTSLAAPKWSTDFAFNLLCKVRRAKISERGKAFFKTGTQHFFEVEGNSAVLHRWGNGPKKILFLHGWESNSQRWIPYYDKLDITQYTVYALDAPGHGMAKHNILNIELYRQAIDYSISKIENVDTVICHSLSNTAISYLYLMNPKIPINRFVIMGAPAAMQDAFLYFQDLLGLSKRVMKNLTDKANTILKISYDRITLHSFLSVATQSILVVHDEADAITPYAPIQKSLKENPKIESFITKGLKHDLKGEEVYKKVVAYINS